MKYTPVGLFGSTGGESDPVEGEVGIDGYLAGKVGRNELGIAACEDKPGLGGKLVTNAANDGTYHASKAEMDA
ncbi:MAG: hypothetical protein ACI4XO_08475, partial [Akkermansia sp.]